MRIISILISVLAYCSATKQTLVLLDNLTIKETHSVFFKSLSERGHKLTFKTADDPGLKIAKYGEYMYDNLILFSPSVEEFGGDLSVDAIVKFVDHGGNLLVAGSTETTDTLRDLASEMGFELDEEGAAVIDHLNYDSADDGMHTLVVSAPGNLVRAPAIVGDGRSDSAAPLLFRGTGILADPDNQLVIPVLTAHHSAYSYKPDSPVTEFPHAAGKSTVLIAAIQARNNARVMFSGSIEFFSDKFFAAGVQTAAGKKYSKCGNEALVSALSKWVFLESGVLRAGRVKHHKKGEKNPPAAYTINEQVVFAIELEQLVEGQWKPFVASDVQMQFVRIDPFVRHALRPGSGCWMQTTFRLPDIYGVFKFQVVYNRLGFTRIDSTTQVSVRPLEHTQYERFIASAYPYYGSAFSMMISCFVFSFVFLHYRNDNAKSKAE